MKDNRRKPVKIVAVKDAKVRDPKWREKLKDWAEEMEHRFGDGEETPVGPVVTKEWIKYVEELEAKVDKLEMGGVTYDS